MPFLRVDADKIVYSVGYTCQKTNYYVVDGGKVHNSPYKSSKPSHKWAEKNYPGNKLIHRVVPEPLSHALFLVKRAIGKITQKFKGHEPILYLTDDNLHNNFRYDVAKTLGYKENRADTSRPIHYEAIREYMLTKFKSKLVSGVEADDAVIMDYEPEDIIAAVDKDLWQFPARFYNYDKDKEFVVSKEEGWYNFYTQVLYGDKIDNIPGMRYWCKPRKLGVKAIEKLFKECEVPTDYYEKIKEAYTEHLDSEEYDEELFRERFLEQAQLLYLWREEDDLWDWDKLNG